MKYNSLIIDTKFIKFVSAGSLAALINFVSRIILSLIFNYITSIVIAYLLGMISAYFLCRLFVFNQKKNNDLQQIIYLFEKNLRTLLVFVYLFLPVISATNILHLGKIHELQ